MRYAAVAALAALTALSACNRREEAAAPAAPVEIPAPAAAGPLTYEKSTPSAEISLKLPERVGQLPALYAQLFASGRNTLDGFAEGAVGEIEELRSAGLPAQPYGRSIEYAVAAETPRLISLTVTHYENTGGAHPNGSIDGLTWDKATGKVVPTAELFAPGADMTIADRALCVAVRAAKMERTGQAEFSGGEFNGCPPLRSAAATLAPSTVAGKAGGLTVLFSPYQIGPYAEGAYEITLPLAAIRSVLAPAYAAEFDGAPPPAPAQTPAQTPAKTPA
jgi:hypothetical protein